MSESLTLENELINNLFLQNFKNNQLDGECLLYRKNKKDLDKPILARNVFFKNNKF